MSHILTFIHWNVDPEIFRIGPIAVRWYGLMFFFSFSIGYYLMERMFRAESINEKWLSSLFYYLVFATIIGARLGHVLFYSWDYYSRNPVEIIKIWHGGLASHGGAIGIIIAMLIYSHVITKRPVLWILDRIVVPTALAGALIRLGNLMNSEIYGVETKLPWGFIFERNGEIFPKHPTQIYESLSYLFIFFILMFMYWRTKSRNKLGLLTGAFLFLVFIARFLIEFVKEDQESFEADMILNMGQWLSIPFILLGLILIIRSASLNHTHQKLE